MSPSEAFLSLSTPSTHLLDIRMPEQVQREGVPFHAHEKGMMVVQHAPWLLVSIYVQFHVAAHQNSTQHF